MKDELSTEEETIEVSYGGLSFKRPVNKYERKKEKAPQRPGLVDNI